MTHGSRDLAWLRGRVELGKIYSSGRVKPIHHRRRGFSLCHSLRFLSHCGYRQRGGIQTHCLRRYEGPRRLTILRWILAARIGVGSPLHHLPSVAEWNWRSNLQPGAGKLSPSFCSRSHMLKLWKDQNLEYTLTAGKCHPHFNRWNTWPSLHKSFILLPRSCSKENISFVNATKPGTYSIVFRRLQITRWCRKKTVHQFCQYMSTRPGIQTLPGRFPWFPAILDAALPSSH